MDVVQFPERISGHWIFLERFKNKNAVTVLMRREFFLSADSGDNAQLFITANSFYQLFINGSPAGAGPRMHQSPGTSFIDAFDVGLHLQPGKNVIAVLVHWNIDEKRGDFSLCPGMWCQLQDGSRILLQSDESWQVLAPEEGTDGAFESGSWSRTFCDLRQSPEDWIMPGYPGGDGWEKPDIMALPGEAGALMELHPLRPAEISFETAEFNKRASGTVEKMPVYTSMLFPRSFNGMDGAAVSYVFCDDSESVTVKLYSRSPIKFFCGRELLFEGSRADGEEMTLTFEKGWTRLCVFVPAVKQNTEVMLLADEWPANLLPLNDMLEFAQPGWCIAPLGRLRFKDCTFAVRVENLPGVKAAASESCCISFASEMLRNARIAEASDSVWLSEGRVELWSLEKHNYGFVSAEFTAHEGDIVDIIVGTDVSSGSFLPGEKEEQHTVSCICREGKNEFRSIVPVDCSCVLIWVRRAKDTLTLSQLVFEELLYPFDREHEFRCSEAIFTEFWRAGIASLRRTSAYLVPSDGSVKHNSYLLDAFCEAVNVAAVCGDSGYITSKLRQFAGTQLENGALTALSASQDYEQAFFHTFFFPGWILFNYRFTSNMVEMRSLIHRLDGVKHYLVSLIDEKSGLLDPALIPAVGPGECDPVVSCRLPVVMNALFCRFMMSASELYDLVERPSEARACRTLLRRMSAAIIENFFDAETSMFADHPITPDGHMDFSLLGNFFPLLAGMKTEECFEKFVKTFFDFSRAAALTAEAESPYFHWLFTEMLFALGQKEWGTQYLRAYWEKRLDAAKGAWKASFKNGLCTTRFADGESVVPNVFLSREILGVRLAEPAYAVIYFDPAISIVESAEGVVPTGQGRIKVKWAKQPDGGLEVDIFASHPVKVLPELPEAVLKNSTFRLSEHVTLVKAAAR